MGMLLLRGIFPLPLISMLSLVLYLFLSDEVLGTKWEALSKQVIWLNIWLEDLGQE
jgi:hypothetical protein